MEKVGGKEMANQKMGQPSVLAAFRISTGPIPSDFRRQANGLSFVTIGKIHQAAAKWVPDRNALSKTDIKAPGDRILATKNLVRRVSKICHQAVLKNSIFSSHGMLPTSVSFKVTF